MESRSLTPTPYFEGSVNLKLVTVLLNILYANRISLDPYVEKRFLVTSQGGPLSPTLFVMSFQIYCIESFASDSSTK